MDRVRVFVIDPPWNRKKGGLRKVRKRQGRALDYPTMSVPAIFSLLDREIFPLAEELGGNLERAVRRLAAERREKRKTSINP